MVETRSRRKPLAPPAAAGGGGEAAPSSSGQQAAAGEIDYADMYRQKHRREVELSQSSLLRRIKARAVLFYHQQAITWAWYMLEPWETLLWMALLCLLSYFVLSACLVSPSSICRQGLVAAHQGLVERGAKLLAYTRQQ